MGHAPTFWGKCMTKNITVLWGSSLSDLTEGKDHISLKNGRAHIAKLKKSTLAKHQAYRLVITYTDGDFKPSKEIIYAESESERRLEKRLLDRGINKS